MNETAFDMSDQAAISPVGMLYQMGYLTICVISAITRSASPPRRCATR